MIDTPNTQIHNRLHFWLCTGASIKNGGVKAKNSRSSFVVPKLKGYVLVFWYCWIFELYRI